MKNSKKKAPSAPTLEANAAGTAKTISNTRVAENDDFVNSKEWKEIAELFDELSRSEKERVVRFVKLYTSDPEFAAAFDARFSDIEKHDHSEVKKFIDTWEGGAA